jgi:hypothetical protein
VAAPLAVAVQHDLVPGHTEAARREPWNARDAAEHLEDLAAPAAVEMVVMVLAGDLISPGLAGQFDRHEPPLLDESAEGPVDGRDAQAWDSTLGRGQDVLGRHGPVARLEGVTDGRALPGLANHAPLP